MTLRIQYLKKDDAEIKECLGEPDEINTGSDTFDASFINDYDTWMIEALELLATEKKITFIGSYQAEKDIANPGFFVGFKGVFHNTPTIDGENLAVCVQPDGEVDETELCFVHQHMKAMKQARKALGIKTERKTDDET